jgi:hypothetical protein
LEEFKEHFENTVGDIETLDEIIEDTIGDGQLVFIDDLDRCHIDNIIGMLEAIKILFNAKNAKFIVAVDLKKLERAWALKHNNDANAIEEGKDHLDKIFQLKLNLPNKSEEEINAYIDKIAENFPWDLRDIVRVGCKANPRKIKRLMNILYVMLNSLDDSYRYPYLFTWSKLSTSDIPQPLKVFIKDRFNIELTDDVTVERTEKEITIKDGTNDISIELDDVPQNAAKAAIKIGNKFYEFYVKKRSVC